ncbi:indolethylamine N-methyltransferase-like [Ixodes scapularis]
MRPFHIDLSAHIRHNCRTLCLANSPKKAATPRHFFGRMVSTSHCVESMASQALRDAYKERFLPRQYLDELVFGKYSSSQIERLHNFFQSDLIQGETLLDVGSGPVVFSSLIASSKFKHIVLSDLVEGNRLELNKWINDEEGAIDWSHAAEQIAAVEGKSDIKKGALEIIERTRSAIRKVVPCDVLEPGVLPMEHRETFDVVISNGCLDAAAADHESFRRTRRLLTCHTKLHSCSVDAVQKWLTGREAGKGNRVKKTDTPLVVPTAFDDEGHSG